MGFREFSDDAQRSTFWLGIAGAAVTAIAAGIYWDWWLYLWNVPPPIRAVVILAAVVSVFVLWFFVARVGHLYFGWPKRDPLDKRTPDTPQLPYPTIRIFRHVEAHTHSEVVFQRIRARFEDAGWRVEITRTEVTGHEDGIRIIGKPGYAREAAKWGLEALGIKWIAEERTNPPDILEIVVGRYDDKAQEPVTSKAVDDLKALLKASDLECRSAKNSIQTLETELRSERKKNAMAQLVTLGRNKNGLNITVRFIDYSDANQADHIRALMLSTTKWPASPPVRDDGSVTRRLGPNRIECASGNPELAKAVTHALNHGMLLGEWVDEREIIDSGSDNITITIFPRSSMPPS